MDAQERDVSLLRRARIEIGEGVDPYDIVAAVKQRLGQMRADEAGATGDDVVTHDVAPMPARGVDPRGRSIRPAAKLTTAPVVSGQRRSKSDTRRAAALSSSRAS